MPVSLEQEHLQGECQHIFLLTVPELTFKRGHKLLDSRLVLPLTRGVVDEFQVIPPQVSAARGGVHQSPESISCPIPRASLRVSEFDAGRSYDIKEVQHLSPSL